MRIAVLKERAAGFPDAPSAAAGAWLAGSADEALAGAHVVLRVQPPNQEEAGHLPSGAVLISLLPASSSSDLLSQLARRNITALGLERVPRITRAQSMDVLSSQATVAGYKAVLLGASTMPRLLPMMTTAAGSLTPGKALWRPTRWARAPKNRADTRGHRPRKNRPAHKRRGPVTSRTWTW